MRDVGCCLYDQLSIETLWKIIIGVQENIRLYLQAFGCFLYLFYDGIEMVIDELTSIISFLFAQNGIFDSIIKWIECNDDMVLGRHAGACYSDHFPGQENMTIGSFYEFLYPLHTPHPLAHPLPQRLIPDLPPQLLDFLHGRNAVPQTPRSIRHRVIHQRRDLRWRIVL